VVPKAFAFGRPIAADWKMAIGVYLFCPATVANRTKDAGLSGSASESHSVM
jgi:hypothetical protein